ncbi:hypothetical protein RISK_006486 [Rhodopirellula islandica]|uniref:Uncharacterized protein n=1 Tax=Rhodopirellula islandica TaxID=595434 RepID=A0A0J1B348_RHOIS|nr:hypothetical protein RISK_006486 [Rhodopirellula islandica]
MDCRPKQVGRSHSAFELFCQTGLFPRATGAIAQTARVVLPAHSCLPVSLVDWCQRHAVGRDSASSRFAVMIFVDLSHLGAVTGALFG